MKKIVFIILLICSFTTGKTESNYGLHPEEVEEQQYKFAPAAFEWLETLGFIKKEDVIGVLKDMLKIYDVQFEEMKSILEDKVSLSEKDCAKLKFLLNNVVAYK